MNDLDSLIANAQRNITYGYILLFTLSLAALIFMPKPIDPQTNTLLVTLLSVLGTILVQQSSFWFARQRSAGVPDPTSVGPVSNVENMNVAAPVKPAAVTDPGQPGIP